MPYIDGRYWESQDRKLWAEARIYNYTYDYGQTNTLASFELERSLVNTNNLTFGNVCSSKLVVKLVNVSEVRVNTFYRGERVDFEVGTQNSSSEAIHYIFFIDEIEKTERRTHSYYDVTLTCYDLFSLCNSVFEPNGTGTRTAYQIAEDVLDDIPIGGFFRIGDGFISTAPALTELPVGATEREILGYLGGYLGGNVITYSEWYEDLNQWISVVDVIQFNSTSKTITPAEQYLDGYTIDGDLVSITRVESGAGDDDIAVYPEDGTLANSISYFCPFIHDDSAGQQRVRAIQESIMAYTQGSALTFYPTTVRWRGNPNITIGDVVTINDRAANNRKIIIMNETISFDGGLSQTFKCFGDAQKKVSFSMTNEMQKINTIERQVTVLEQEMADATEALTDLGIIDGYFSFIKAPGSNRNIGWKIESNVDRHYIMANKNGIGFSSDGGQTFGTAIYIDNQGYGHINGAYVTAHTINAEALSFQPITTANVDSYVNADINTWYNGLLIDGTKITNIAGNSDFASLVTTVNGKATPAQAAAAGRTAANEQISALTTAHNLTYIGADGIYTGTIHATQLELGYGGFNYALFGAYSTGSNCSVDVYIDSGGTEGRAVYMLNSSVTSSTEEKSRAVFQPFFCTRGATLSWAIFLSSMSGSGQLIGEVRYTTTREYTNSQWLESIVFDSSDSLKLKYIDRAAPIDGYYWFIVRCSGSVSSVNTYMCSIQQSVSGNAIVNGSIKSMDGNTYFDLANSEIVTESGNKKTTIKSGEITAFSGNSSNNVSVSLKDGTIKLSGKNSDVNGEIGQLTMRSWIEETGSQSVTKWGPCFLYNSNVADGLIFGRYGNSNEVIVVVNYTRGMLINSDLTVYGTIHNSSSEKYKKEISEYKGNSLDLITNAKIYSYLYNKDEETDPLQYGVIIERECPKEIVSKNGDSISLYSMTSLAWKAIQELSDKIKDLEERL